MAKRELWFQCDLSQGAARQVAFIEERAAVVGASVEIEPGSGDFWTVDQVGKPGMTRESVRGVQDGYHKGFASISG